MPPRIDQFHSGSAPADAVTNGMLFARELLRGLGFESEIYVEHPHKALDGKIHSYKKYKGGEQDILIVHHSMGHDLLEWILRTRARKVLVYHNITPPSFFPPGSDLRAYARLGLEQLPLLAAAAVRHVADSSFSAAELSEIADCDPVVLPLLLDLERVRATPFDEAPISYGARPLTILSVGRIVENKCLLDVIETFSVLTQLVDRPCRLRLLGGIDEGSRYTGAVRGLIESRGLSEYVELPGKVPDGALYGAYRSADAYLCMSEHEGFCVPLIEAMAFDLPVVAFGSSAIPATLGGAGILLREKKHTEAAAVLALLSEDRAFRRRILVGQRERVQDFESAKLREGLCSLLRSLEIEPPTLETTPALRKRLAYQVEGPFETHYSLALVNREMARALDERAPGTVALRATEGPGDYTPAKRNLAAHGDLEPLWKRGRKGAMPQVSLRMLYPPRVNDADGLLRLLNFAWEESQVPSEWVEAFNAHLDGIVVISSFIKKALQDSGVFVPVHVIGCGYDHIERTERGVVDEELGDGFRFLHVSSGFPRKGIDVLLKAWQRAFTDGDEVTLVLKTFPNVHNEVRSQVKELRRKAPRSARIVVIDEDLEPTALLDLYLSCHAVVCPSRGEGFGLPMAEAMALGRPVITTSTGGHRDFCRPDTAWLTDCHFEQSQSHIGLVGSVWVEPDPEHLATNLQEVARGGPAAEAKVEEARRTIEENFKWGHCAERLSGFEEALMTQTALGAGKVKVDWVSTWNTRCGIATYSRYLLDELPAHQFDVRVLASTTGTPLGTDGDDVLRCWGDRSDRDLAQLESALLARRPDVAVFQFNYGFHSLKQWAVLLARLEKEGICTIATLHATAPVDDMSFESILEPLSRVDRLLVHSVSDLNRLKRMGLERNVTLFPHGAFPPSRRSRTEARAMLGIGLTGPVVASYGFLLPPKGIEQLIEAFAEVKRAIPTARLLLVNAIYPAPVSETLRLKCLASISALGLSDSVTMFTDFLEESRSMTYLEAADLIVFPYQGTGESASGAIRFGLSASRPILCTPLDIFRDVKELVYHASGTDPESLSDAIIERLEADGDPLAEVREHWLASHRWSVMAKRLGGLMRALVQDRDLELDR